MKPRIISGNYHARILDIVTGEVLLEIEPNSTIELVTRALPDIFHLDIYDNSGVFQYRARLCLYAASTQPLVINLSDLPTTVPDDIQVFLRDNGSNPIDFAATFHISPTGALADPSSTLVVESATGTGSVALNLDTYPSVRSINFSIEPTGVISSPVEPTITRPEFYSDIAEDLSPRVFFIVLPQAQNKYVIGAENAELAEHFIVFRNTPYSYEPIYSGDILNDGSEYYFLCPINITGYEIILFGTSMQPYSATITGTEIAAGEVFENRDPVTTTFDIDPTSGTYIDYILVVTRLGENLNYTTYIPVRPDDTSVDYTHVTPPDTTITYSFGGIYLMPSVVPSSDETVTVTIPEHNILQVETNPSTPFRAYSDELGVEFISGTDNIISIPYDSSVSSDILYIFAEGYEVAAEVVDPTSGSVTIDLTSDTERTATIRITDTDGNPVFARVKIKDLSSAEQIFDREVDGLVLLNLPEGTYLVTASSFGYTAKSELMLVGDHGAELTVVLEPREHVDVGSLILTIQDAYTGRTIPGAVVKLYRDPEHPIIEYTDESGVVFLRNVELNTNYNLEISKDNFTTYVGTLTLPSSPNHIEDIASILNPVGLSVTGSMIDSTPVFSITIALERHNKLNEITCSLVHPDLLPPGAPYVSHLTVPVHYLSADHYSPDYTVLDLTERTVSLSEEDLHVGDTTTDERYGKIGNYLSVPGKIAGGSYETLRFDAPLDGATNLYKVSWVKQDLSSDGLKVLVCPRRQITLELVVNGSPLDVYTVEISSDYETPSITRDGNKVTFDGYLFTPYKIKIRAANLYFDDTVAFIQDKAALDVPRADVPVCGVTVKLLDNNGEGIPNLNVTLRLRSLMTGYVTASTYETTEVLSTDENGEIHFEAPYGIYFEIVSNDDEYPIYGSGVVPATRSTVYLLGLYHGLVAEYTFTLTVGGSPVEGASVWLTLDEEGTYTIAGPKTTDASGNVKFMLNRALGYVHVWAYKDGIVDGHVAIWPLE